MDNSKKIPLAERMNRIAPGKVNIPRAFGMCAVDLLELVGEMTGQKARYEEIYRANIEPHCGTGDIPKCVCELAAEAAGFEPEERAKVLFSLLVDPFAALNKIEGGEAS